MGKLSLVMQQCSCTRDTNENLKDLDRVDTVNQEATQLDLQEISCRRQVCELCVPLEQRSHTTASTSTAPPFQTG